MRLAAAAGHFDKQVFTDAYGPTVPTGTWKLDTAEFTLDFNQATLDGFILYGAPAFIVGQLDLFDDGKRDSFAAGRRILSVIPNMPIMSRRVVRLGDYVWIIGNGNPDYFRQAVIRRKYILHEADGLASIKTFGQYLANTTGLSIYAAAEWTKAAREIDESSDLIDVAAVICASTEVLPGVGVMVLSATTYLLREPHPTSGGFQSATIEEIKAPVVETGSFAGRTYDPVADTWAGAGTPVSFIRLRWQSHFEYLSKRTLHYEAGDSMLICLKTAATPKANDRVTLSDGLYQVLTVQSDNDCWSCHVRLIPA